MVDRQGQATDSIQGLGNSGARTVQYPSFFHSWSRRCGGSPQHCVTSAKPLPSLVSFCPTGEQPCPAGGYLHRVPLHLLQPGQEGNRQELPHSHFID